LYWYGIENNYRTLVTDIYGPSLEQLLKYCKGAFTLKTVLLIADQILERIEWVHSKGLIYNDIEPDNFLVGLGEKQDKIFMIDFGSCQKYLDSDNNHSKFENEKEVVKSNPKFRSIYVHTKKSII
jgi:casein kinase 1